MPPTPFFLLWVKFELAVIHFIDRLAIVCSLVWHTRVDMLITFSMMSASTHSV